MRPMKKGALEQAVEKAGGQAALAKRLQAEGFAKCVQSHVWNWLNRDDALPAEYVLPIERITGVSRHDLRPDIYPLDAA